MFLISSCFFTFYLKPQAWKLTKQNIELKWILPPRRMGISFLYWVYIWLHVWSPVCTLSHYESDSQSARKETAETDIPPPRTRHHECWCHMSDSLWTKEYLFPISVRWFFKSKRPWLESCLSSIFCPTSHFPCPHSSPLFPALLPCLATPSIPRPPYPPSRQQRVYLLLIFWLGSLPTPVSPHFSVQSVLLHLRPYVTYSHTLTYAQTLVCLLYRQVRHRQKSGQGVRVEVCACMSVFKSARRKSARLSGNPHTEWEHAASIFRSI